MARLTGRACKHELTKILIQKINKNCIAVIKHKDIDLVAAQDLEYKKVKAVINCERSVDSCFLGEGVKYLLDKGVKIYDVSEENFFDEISDGDFICITDGMVYVNNIFRAYCSPVCKDGLELLCSMKSGSIKEVKCNFILNTMEHMVKELEYFTSIQNLPPLNTEIQGKDVLIVSRGRGYRDDLRCIKRFIQNKRPVLIGVDGGGDALLDMGLKCHIIIGDMDSVSDKCLKSCGEILVHTYCSGYAPGLNRIVSMGLDYKLIMLKGTSEDAAIYLSKLKGASKIYLIGSHTGFDEFIEKGRRGMGSTALIRMFFGSSIIDLKGISSLTPYNDMKHNWASIACAFTLLLIIAIVYYKDFLKYLEPVLKVITDFI